MAGHNYYIYILTNKSNTVLYTGVTRDIIRRLGEHRHGVGSGFTRKYALHKLVYFEHFSRIETAIAREKQIKSGSRANKVALIESMNQSWKDLADDLV